MSRQGASLRSPERFVFLIALNAVYLVGPLFFGWTVGTVLLLFWFEALVTALTAAVRLHRQVWYSTPLSPSSRLDLHGVGRGGG